MMEELDPLIDCIDSHQAEPRVCRRAALASCLEKSGHTVVSLSALRYVARAGAFFDDVPAIKWLEDTFGETGKDPEERVIRFMEEGMELAQTEGVTREQMHALVDQVFDKPVGDREQELGGTLVTLSSYMAVRGLNGVEAFNNEFDRCRSDEVVQRIREKHRTKSVVSSKRR